MIARTILEARIAEVREALRLARLMRHLAVVFALGVVVRGGLLLATLVTKGLVPLLYVLFVETLHVVDWKEDTHPHA